MIFCDFRDFELAIKNTNKKDYQLRGEKLMDSYISNQNVHTLKEAAYFMINAYDSQKKSGEILEILDQVFWLPNIEAFSANYMINKKNLESQNNITELPDFTELPFHIYPLDDTEMFLYDSRHDRFLYDGIWDDAGFIALKMASEDWSQLKSNNFFGVCIQRYILSLKSYKIKKDIEITLSNDSQDKKYIKQKINMLRKLQPENASAFYYDAMLQYNSGLFKDAYISIHKALEISLLTPAFHALCIEICIKLNKRKEARVHYMQMAAVLDELYSANVLKSFELGLEQEETMDDLLTDLSIATTCPCFFPRYTEFFLDGSSIDTRTSLYLLKFLRFSKSKPYNHFVALRGQGYTGAGLSFADVSSKSHSLNEYMRIKTEVVKSFVAKQWDFVRKDCDIILPICGNGTNNKANYIDHTQPKNIRKVMLEPGQFKYLRLSKNSSFSGESSPLIFGKPIELKHSKKRKKLVLSIFIDTLSMWYLKQRGLKDMPNTFSFFKDGAIFTDVFCSAEHTCPSLPAIRTGMYPYHTQIFERNFPMTLSKKHKVPADYLSEKGYLCSAYSCSIDDIFLDLHRNFDIYVNQFAYNYNASSMINDLMDHIRAFRETDNYLELNVAEPHWTLEDVILPLEFQTQYPIELALDRDCDTPSVWQKENILKKEHYNLIVQRLDEDLARIYEYIKQNYKDDEYLIYIYSDHGSSALSEENYLLKDAHTNSCFFIKGAGVPALGLVDDEIVSALDILPSVNHFLNIPCPGIDGRLPKAFGGEGRKYAITQSVFEGQTYKLVIRTKEHEFRLESFDKTTGDGRVNIAQAKYQLFLRDTNHTPVHDADMLSSFLAIAYEHTQTRRIQDTPEYKYCR